MYVFVQYFNPRSQEGDTGTYVKSGSEVGDFIKIILEQLDAPKQTQETSELWPNFEVSK